MKITCKNVDALNKVLTVKIAADDYAAARKKKLSDYQRRAEMPGFRKGKVPASLIEKMYGASALGDAVNNVIAEALENYIKENKLNVIGEPLPCEDTPEQEWKAGNDFTFTFDLASNPEVNFELGKEDEIPSYTINVTEAEKKKLVDAYKAQQEAVAKAAADKNEEAPAAMSEEEMAEKAAEQLKSDYVAASGFRLEKDIREYCVKKAALTLPDKFLRRWLIAVNEGKFTPEQIDKDFDAFLEDYRWQLVQEYLTGKYGLKIEEKDVLEEAKMFARLQYSMYGMNQLPDDILDSFAQQMLQNKEQVQRFVENAGARKVYEAVKAAVTLKPKKISIDKFREL